MFEGKENYSASRARLLMQRSSREEYVFPSSVEMAVKHLVFQLLFLSRNTIFYCSKDRLWSLKTSSLLLLSKVSGLVPKSRLLYEIKSKEISLDASKRFNPLCLGSYLQCGTTAQLFAVETHCAPQSQPSEGWHS